VKAVRFHEFGGPEVLKLEDVEDPAAGPGQVVVRVDGCGLNHLDVDIREGVSRFPISLPHTNGVEVVGRIDELGEGVDGWELGDRVAPYLLGGGAAFLGVTAPGGYAEKIVCPASQLVRVPDSLSDDGAAALQVAFSTSWHMLFNRAQLRVGETVLINSVGSGIGSAAVQLAKLGGAYVIGNASRDDKLAKAKEFGLDVAINYTTTDVVEAVMEATGGKGVDVVYEHVGGELFQKGLDCLKFSGRLVTCGAHAQEVVDFDIIPFFRAQKSVIGSFVYDRDEFEKVLELADRGQITPLVDSTFPLVETRPAMERMESRGFFGKIVLTP
jgi:NADPH:quinone reductase-like Zn-dependent oxidoreductase